ncbi:hypothetical protein ACFVYE_24230 [Streptomyces sp. NPDC058239]|uniref:hypothetical protein n=1 Tax=Streptomyces sp. NPDC058239 TaxID=3346395 RepID=UPI0036E1F94F
MLWGAHESEAGPVDRSSQVGGVDEVVRRSGSRPGRSGTGGLVAAAGINRYASLFEHTAFAHLDRPALQDGIGRILATGSHDGKKGFTEAHFHTGPELEAEMREAGFTDIRVYGVEGPAWALLKATEQHTGESLTGSRMFTSALAAARMAEPYPDLLAAGSHLLAVGRN